MAKHNFVERGEGEEHVISTIPFFNAGDTKITRSIALFATGNAPSFSRVLSLLRNSNYLAGE